MISFVLKFYFNVVGKLLSPFSHSFIMLFMARRHDSFALWDLQSNLLNWPFSGDFGHAESNLLFRNQQSRFNFESLYFDLRFHLFLHDCLLFIVQNLHLSILLRKTFLFLFKHTLCLYLDKTETTFAQICFQIYRIRHGFLGLTVLFSGYWLNSDWIMTLCKRIFILARTMNANLVWELCFG